MYDTVIRGGKIYDGNGGEAFTGDVAINDKKIVEVGGKLGAAKNDIDADGLIVTPGFVDIHTHYDGQATWDALLSPSVYHGVTTVVMGNCGVGFAPVKPDRRDWLISLMEGVEDIPGTALAEGIDWQWESFPEFLDTLDSKQHTIDVLAQLPHGALRTYVMGERGGNHEERPSEAEIEQMAELTREAIEAGAIGFTTSRTVNHQTADGEPTPSLTAEAPELQGIARGLKAAGKGVMQLVCDFEDHDAEFDLIESMVKVSGRPLSVTINQNPAKPDEWRDSLARISAANAAGLPITAQVAPRPVGVLLSLQSTYHPFVMCPSFATLVGKPVVEQVSALQSASLRAQLFQEWQEHGLFPFEQLWAFGEQPDYEPSKSESIAALAEAAGMDGAQYALDTMLQGEGSGMLYFPALNYAGGNLDATREMLVHPYTVPGLGDGGAHVSFISDASFCTYLLTHWSRDRERGDKIPLEYLIQSQTRDTARVVGLHDRGILAPGMKADLNLIDFKALAVKKPAMIQDLPAGGNRLLQGASGYRQMLVDGEVVMHDGAPTGAQPGKLVRGSQGQAH